eukprot:EG_transcript_1758
MADAMADDPFLSSRQRAGSFGRRDSWQLKTGKFPPIKLLETTDIDGMAGFNLSEEQLAVGDAPGDLTPLTALLAALEEARHRNSLDAALDAPFGQAQERLAAAAEKLSGTHAVTTPIPTAYVHELLQRAEAYSTQLQDIETKEKEAGAKVKEIEQQVQANLKQLDQLALAPRYEGEVLPSTALDEQDRFRQAWRDEWWQSDRRQQALHVLDSKRRQWAKDDEADALCGRTQDLLREQLRYAKLQLDALEDVQQLKQSYPAPPPALNAELSQLRKDHAKRRDEALGDLNALDKVERSLERRDKSASSAFDAATQYMNTFIPDNERRLAEVETEMRKLDHWYQEERRIRLYSGHGLAMNTAAVALQQEVVRMRLALREKEEELTREVDIWSQQQEVESRKLLASFLEEIEDKYQKSWNRLSAMKEILSMERAKVMALAPSRVKQEAARQQELRDVLQAIQERKGRLQRAAQVFVEFAIATQAVHEAWGKVQSSIDQLVLRRWQDSRNRVFAHLLQAVEVGAKLYAVGLRLEENKRRRITEADRTATHLNALLEFAVDTYDPNAHRYQAILDEVLAMRRGAESAIQQNVELNWWLTGELLPAYTTLVAHPLKHREAVFLNRLHTEQPQFFDMLRQEKYHPNEPNTTLQVDIPAPPTSSFVQPARPAAAAAAASAAADSPAGSPSAPAASEDDPGAAAGWDVPFELEIGPADSVPSPLPWVAKQRWALDDDDLGSPGSSWAPDGSLSPGLLSDPGTRVLLPGHGARAKKSRPSPTATARPVDPSLGPSPGPGQLRSSSPVTFDHRDFRVYKPFE